MALHTGVGNDDEAAVIDDEMITKALVEAGGMDHEFSANVTFQLPDIIAKANELRLSFKNILAIDNLQGFLSLTKLCLDNNIIGSIQNLDHLTNLTWLDLSFNNIEKIEGLGSLTKLTDLSLFNNKISEIEGLENCKELQCLSLGNNLLAALDSVKELRGFPRLHLVGLEGNPLSRHQEYKYSVLAFLPHLKYLDYALVEEAERLAARENYADEVVELVEAEQLRAEEDGRAARARAQREALQAANLDAAETLFDEMFAEDTEHGKLALMEGVEDAVNEYQGQFKEAAEELKTKGKELDDKKQEEVETFEKAVEGVETYHGGRAVELLQAFERKKKRVFLDLSRKDSVDNTDLHDLREALRALEDELMGLEMQQVEQFEDLAGDFEVGYGELTTASLELLTRFFRAVEEHEEKYSHNVLNIALELLERAAKEEELGDEGLGEELGALLVDRDTCLNAVSTSHDAHVGRLLKREDEAAAREKARAKQLLDDAREKESNRNRNRIVEIQEFVENNERAMKELIKTADYDDDDNF